MALDSYVESHNGGKNKKYHGDGAPPATGSGVTFAVGDLYYKTDPAAAGPYCYVYTSGGWKSVGNVAA